jgi:hypothetical protein
VVAVPRKEPDKPIQDILVSQSHSGIGKSFPFAIPNDRRSLHRTLHVACQCHVCGCSGCRGQHNRARANDACGCARALRRMQLCPRLRC